MLRSRCLGPLGSRSPVCPLGVLCHVCGVLGHLAPIHRCAGPLRCVACAVSWASWLLFTGVLAPCIAWRVCGVLGLLAPVYRCARSVSCVACVRCPWPLGSCSPVCRLRVLCCVCGVLGHLAPPSPVCSLGALCCVCGVLGHLAPVHRCGRSLLLAACAVSLATWLLFTGVLARCVVLRVRCPGRLGSCSPVCSLCGLCCVCGVLGHLAPAHRCARLVLCAACAVSWATWLLFTGVPAWCVALRVRCPGPLGSCSPVCTLGVLCCVCGVTGLLDPAHRCARSACCVARAVSSATWLLFNGVLARYAVLRLRCPGPLGSCSPLYSLGYLCCVCGVLGQLAPVHRCAHSVCCVVCAVSPASWILRTAVLARRVVFRARCPRSKKKCFSNALGYTLVVLEVL